jgi:hypothetical protein
MRVRAVVCPLKAATQLQELLCQGYHMTFYRFLVKDWHWGRYGTF